MCKAHSIVETKSCISAEKYKNLHASNHIITATVLLFLEQR